MKTQNEQEPAVTLWNYKIDYSQPLGEGQFGSVYALVRRPANEQNYLAYCFPYIYDYWYCSDKPSDDEKDNQYCIKIFKQALDTPHIELSFRFPYMEIKNNELLKSNQLTQLDFFEGGFYSQIKTRVIGKTLSSYIRNDYFLNPNNYFFRASFVKFIYSIAHATNLTFWDLKPANIMFDENKYCWEIIDGVVRIERSRYHCNETVGLRKLCQHYWEGAHNEYLFDQLFRQGQQGVYSEKIDEEIINKAWGNLKNQPSLPAKQTRDETTLSKPNNTTTSSVLMQFNAKQIQPEDKKKSYQDEPESIRAGIAYAKSLLTVGLFAATCTVGVVVAKHLKNKLM